jgi:REP element-mobilizing transposase RayT
MKRRPKQLSLVFKTWGGKRRGAGRKPSALQPNVSHTRRPRLDPNHPVHVTLRAAGSVPNLRSQRCMAAVRRAFVGSKGRLGLRLVHFSVQRNHIHLLVEAEGKRALSRGLQGLSVRIARGLNGELGRRGSVFADRYHARALSSPRQTRHALAYVLLNHAHHGPQGGWEPAVPIADKYSSAARFDGWSGPIALSNRGAAPSGIVPGRTWLLSKGWRRAGLINPSEVPGSPRVAATR